MKEKHYIQKLVETQKKGRPRGIYSVCSANPYVIKAAVIQGVEDDSTVLIESTCNQVNQFGGYTGMTPKDFNDHVISVARSCSLAPDKLILGGDHLGPYPFRHEKAEKAMTQTGQMIRAFILAGCTKIHLDASYRLADDPGRELDPLPPETISTRCANLCSEAERAFQELSTGKPDAVPPVYVIGTEVPAPGGNKELVDEELQITSVTDLRETIHLTQKAFYKKGLEEAWERVVAVVVQPGVEHGNHTVIEYDRQKAKQLTEELKSYPKLVFEGHTTDYQTVKALKEMVVDGIAILKTGQSQTAAAREAVFMLNYMEEELLSNREGVTLSKFRETIDQVMQKEPKYWEGYYHGAQPAFDRRYSYFDRQRYYWSYRQVKESLSLLLNNMRCHKIPLSLISQFLPEQYKKIRLGLLSLDPEDLIRDRIMDHMREYSYAVGNRDMVSDWWS